MSNPCKPIAWRGETSGEDFDTFDLGKTHAGVGFFFAEKREQAQFYAAQGSVPRAFELDPGRCLDLVDAAGAFIADPDARAVINALKQEFDEWVDRGSGEERHPVDFLEAGDLYDYEGTGSGQRWNTLFTLAREAGFDSVRVRDITDGVSSEDAMVWVMFDPARIQPHKHRIAAPGMKR